MTGSLLWVAALLTGSGALAAGSAPAPIMPPDRSGMSVARSQPVPTDTALVRYALEFRAGVSGGELASAGSGFQARVRPAGHLVATFPVRAWGWGTVSAYGGWAGGGFTCRDGLCEGAEVRHWSHGPRAGVRVGRSVFWASAGLALERLRANWRDGEPSVNPSGRAETGFGPGFELAGGIAWAPSSWARAGVGAKVLPARTELTPSLRYVRYRVRFPDQARDRLTLLSLEVGVRIRSFR